MRRRRRKRWRKKKRLLRFVDVFVILRVDRLLVMLSFLKRLNILRWSMGTGMIGFHRDLIISGVLRLIVTEFSEVGRDGLWEQRERLRRRRKRGTELSLDLENSPAQDLKASYNGN